MSALDTPAVLIAHVLNVLLAAPGLAGDIVAGGLASGVSVSQADSLAQTAEAGAAETRRAVTVLILCLIAIATGLAALTAWYWHFTSPRRQANVLLSDLGHFSQAGLGQSRAERSGFEITGADQAASSSGPPLAGPPATARPFANAPSKPVKLAPVDRFSSERIEVAERVADQPQVQMPPAKPPSGPKTPVAPKARPAAVVSSKSPVTIPVSSVPGPPVSAAVAVPVVSAPAAVSAPSMPSATAADRPVRESPDGVNEGGAERVDAERPSQEGLSDDDWAAVMQSAFSHLKR